MSLYTTAMQDIINNLMKATNATAFSPFLMLCTTDPGPAGTQTAELPNANGYARLAIPWGTTSGGVLATTTDVTFTNSGGVDWPVINAIAVVDSITYGAGTIRERLVLSSPILVGIGKSLRFAAGSIVHTP